MSAKVRLDADHFDAVARRWDENPVFQARAERIAAAIAASVPLRADMRALDYGSGTGLLSFALRDRLGDIVLKDTSPGMLAVAEEKIRAAGIGHMRTRLMDLSTGAAPDERYDLIYSAMTLHHVPDTAAILTAFHRLLTPGGWLCIADLDAEDGSFHGAEVDVHHGFKRDALAQTTEAVGFEDVAFQTVFEIVKARDDGERAYPVFLMVARRPV